MKETNIFVNAGNPIVMLSPKQLYHHPENPRKNIGDVTELADSMRVMGVMQNLTVVPYDPAIHIGLTVTDPDNAYVVVIGNRRMEGALKANLETVPCVIANMDRAKQLKTMIIENTMREDLTVMEEADCYQLMLDMGESVEEIAKNTGVSAATIRRRVKLLELDRDALAQAQARGGTLQDYAKLDQIKDTALRNKVLNSIGTPNFRSELKYALDQQKNHEKVLTLLPQFEVFATRIEKIDPATMGFVSNTFAFDTSKPVPVPKDADTVKYYFFVGSQQIDLYKERSACDADKAAREAKVMVEQNRYELLVQAAKRAYELRKDFIRDFSPKKAEKMLPEITAYTLRVANDTFSSYGNMNHQAVAELLEIGIDKDFSCRVIPDEYDAAIRRNPAYALLVTGWAIKDHVARGYFNRTYNARKCVHTTNYYANDTLDQIYDFLKKLGYAMSDEEIQLQNGNHSLFAEDFTIQEPPSEQVAADEHQVPADLVADCEEARSEELSEETVLAAS